MCNLLTIVIIGKLQFLKNLNKKTTSIAQIIGNILKDTEKFRRKKKKNDALHKDFESLLKCTRLLLIKYKLFSLMS